MKSLRRENTWGKVFVFVLCCMFFAAFPVCAQAEQKAAAYESGSSEQEDPSLSNDYIAYCNEVMDTYLKENITDSMTDGQIMRVIAKFPAMYDYSVSCSSFYTMIIKGGGDCEASTGAILKLCEKMGIKAWVRNGNKDPLAGSGHVNAIAELNGTYYILEAGYNEKKGADGYRTSTVTARDTLFSYSRISGSEISVYQYDGYEQPEILEVPETIDGRTVTEIADKAFIGDEFSEIRLPDTVTKIGDYAFSGCTELVRMDIPAAVTSIGISPFSDCKKLKNISIPEENPSYKVQEQTIYSKDGSTLVSCQVSDAVTIPSTVTKIEPYAFYYNNKLKKIVIPESVVELGEGAFGDCTRLSSVSFEGEGLTRIGTFCFRNNQALSALRIPASVTSLGTHVFQGCSSLKYVYFRGDAPKIGGIVENTFYDRVFQGCSLNAYYIDGNDTWTPEVLKDYGGEVVWSSYKESQEKSIEGAVLTLEKDNYTYAFKLLKPAVTLTLDGAALSEGEDYIVSYYDNFHAGTATAIATGVGAYYGEVRASFTIDKRQGNVYIPPQSGEIMEKEEKKIQCYGNGDSELTYVSSDPSVVSVNRWGVIQGISAGTAEITICQPESEDCTEASAVISITVSHDLSEVVDAAVADGCIKVKCELCGEDVPVSVPTNYLIYWSEGGSAYALSCKSSYAVGSWLDCMARDTSGADWAQMEVISLNEDIIQITENQILPGNRYLNFIADGVAQVLVRPKYNPEIGRTFTFYVGDAANTGDGNQGQEPEKPEEGNAGDGNQGQEPEKPEEGNTGDGNQGQEPEKPEEGNTGDGNQSQEPEKPEEGNTGDGNQGQEPEKPEEGNTGDSNQGQEPEKPEEGNTGDSNQGQEPEKPEEGNAGDGNQGQEPEKPEEGNTGDGNQSQEPEKPESGSAGGGSQNSANPGGSNPANGTQTNIQNTKYYDKNTGITVSIDSSKKEATLKTVDKKHAKGTLTIPATVKVNGTAYKLTAVGKNAFKNQKQLKKVTIGKNIKKIDENAFYGCDKLQTVTFGKNVTTIGNKAFYKCKKLKKITIPSKVQKIGKSAFYGCKRLKEITIQSKKLTDKNVGSSAFKGIAAKPTIEAPKSKISAHKKMLRAKGVGAKIKMKKL